VSNNEEGVRMSEELEYPEYKVLENYECTKCHEHTTNEIYSMLWKGEPYCPRCALIMKNSGEVKDRVLIMPDLTAEDLKKRRNEL
jgi:ribosomal protein L37AE/L43A